MKTVPSSIRAEQSLFGTFLAALTASLGFASSSEPMSRLASSLAAELRTEAGVPALVIELSSLPRNARTEALLRAAKYFRGDWNTFGIADALRRLTRSDLFHAVINELQSSTQDYEASNEITLCAAFAEVA